MCLLVCLSALSVIGNYNSSGQPMTPRRVRFIRILPQANKRVTATNMHEDSDGLMHGNCNFLFKCDYKSDRSPFCWLVLATYPTGKNCSFKQLLNCCYSWKYNQSAPEKCSADLFYSTASMHIHVLHVMHIKTPTHQRIK